MLQKYFPILSEINSPLASLIALGFTAEAVKVAVNGISNEVLEELLWNAAEATEARKQEIEVSIAALEAARVAAAKELRTLRYRAAQAARKARSVSKTARQVKAAKKPATLKSCKGLSLEICRSRVAEAQVAVRVAATTFNTASTAVAQAIEGGDIRTIRAAIAALKVAVRELEVRHLEFKFAREMLAISLARHSA